MPIRALPSLMMSFLRNLQMYGRFALGLPGFLKKRVSVDEACELVRQGVAEREANFMTVVRRAIFDNPRSPYLPLLALAKWELADIERSVKTIGLEPTLRELRKVGVYFTFEEYKGKTPVVRGGEVIPIEASDFDNPFMAKAYAATTGGSTGAGTRVAIDLETMAAQIPQIFLGRKLNGLLDGPLAIWHGPLPDATGVGIILRAVIYGGVPERWFSPMTREDFRPPPKDRLATSGIIAISRLFGVRFPKPEPVPIGQAGVIARWAANAARDHGSCVVGTTVSLAVRICLAARDEGLDLSGVLFAAGGEPFTSARSRVIAQAGARLVPHYISVDAGPIGVACANPSAEDDFHFLSDCLALIQHPRTIRELNTTVDPFYFTSLRPTAAKILLNVESDDHGVVEERACGCPFGELGYSRHLRQIRSFGKLTGEGVTLVGSEMVHILEEVLPARFGGGPFDYQLLEEEDEHGLSCLSLLVSPRLSIEREDLIVSTVLEALGRSSPSADIARAFWKQTGTFRVKRVEPVWTGRGKFLSIRVSGRHGEPVDSVESVDKKASGASQESPSSKPTGVGTAP